jgi:hypothetical protein
MPQRVWRKFDLRSDDLMLPFLDAPSQRLDAPGYVADFDKRFWRITGEGFWKLECLQNYLEPGFASWEAFRRGDWESSLRLIEDSRPELNRYYERVAAAGFAMHRARVVQEPVTPYTQWELQVLKARAESGEEISVITADQLEDTLVPYSDLPDLVVLGSEAAYLVLYTQAGSPDGAFLFTDAALIAAARDFISSLCQVGEDIQSYFDRNISGLRAPDI